MINNGNSKIVSVGAFIPDQVVSSVSLLDEIQSDTRYGIPNNYISDIIGIKNRHVADESIQQSDMATLSSEMAIARAGINPQDIDLVIFCGIERDYNEPSTAHFIQHRIGAENAKCFDVSNACHGFIDGITIADAWLGMGMIDTALICTGEKASGVLFNVLQQIKDGMSMKKFTRMVGGLTVGDGGGAMILQRNNLQSGFNKFNIRSQGKHANLCKYKYDCGQVVGNMEMKRISNTIVDSHAEIIDETYLSSHWNSEDVDLLIAHQVGERPHKRLAEVAKVPLEKAPVTYNEYGNLTSATIPIALHLNQPRDGNKILIMGAGSGLTISQISVNY